MEIKCNKVKKTKKIRGDSSKKHRYEFNGCLINRTKVIKRYIKMSKLFSSGRLERRYCGRFIRYFLDELIYNRGSILVRYNKGVYRKIMNI